MKGNRLEISVNLVDNNGPGGVICVNADDMRMVRALGVDVRGAIQSSARLAEIGYSLLNMINHVRSTSHE